MKLQTPKEVDRFLNDSKYSTVQKLEILAQTVCRQLETINECHKNTNQLNDMLLDK